ncbi:MAG: Lrp/AsnC family transcriptional regulator [Sphingobium sp.]
MDIFDLKIIESLERDGRQSFADLASDVGLSKTPCWSRVQALEKTGVIRGYRADVNPALLGLGVFAIVQVMIDFSRRNEFEQAVLNSPAILECYTTVGEADYLLKVACKDLDSLDDLLRHTLTPLPGVQRSTTMLCLKTVKSNTIISKLISV